MKMRFLTILLLCTSVIAYGLGNSFDNIRYNGGSIATSVDPKDWGNHLTVNSDEILLALKDGQSIHIDPRRVIGLSYGQEAHRRVGTMIALGILVAPLALFGLLHKTRLHFVGIEYTDSSGKKAGVLLQAHKNNYRAVLMALRSVTGAPVAVAEEDRKYVPTGVDAEVVSPKETEASATPTQSSTIPSQPTPQPSTTVVTSNSPVAPPTPTARDYDKVEIGMDAPQVRRIMGEPDSIYKTKTEQGASTTWEYKLADGKKMTIMFKQAVVNSVQIAKSQ